ncbi:MAG: prepilin-type N-terminal cleavage/methylation domain-containing protein [Acidimicrobiales bacterium]
MTCTSTRPGTGRSRGADGFTLVEVLVAVVLVGVLSAVVVVGVGRITSRGQSAACTGSADAARTAAPAHLASTGAYPTTFTQMTASGSLSLPAGVTIDASGTVASGNGWTLSLRPGAVGGPPLFTCSIDLPIADPAAWYDAAASSTITSSQVCTTAPGWRDRTGNGFDLLSPTPTTTVAWSATGLNGRPAVITDGTTYLRMMRSPGARTVFVVARSTGAPAARILSSAAGNWLLGWWWGWQDQAYFEGWVSNPSTPVTTQAILYSTTIPTSSASTVYRNGTQIASNAGGVTPPAGLAVGGSGTYTGEKSAAAISEVITYDRVLTTAERQETEQYLADKWGLTVAATATSRMAVGPTSWFDATDQTDLRASLTSCTESVTSWADRSGHGMTLTPRTAAAATGSTSATLNGLPVVTTSGLNALTNSSVRFTGDATVFVVARYTGAGFGQRVLSSTNNNWLLGWWGNTQDRAHFDSWLPGSSSLSTAPALYSAAIAVGVRADVYKNGAAMTSSTTATTTPNGISIGGWPTSEFTQADVAEVIAYGRLLSTDERRAVEAYLAAKWGLTVV